MKFNKIIYISGGARSGKSTFAEKLSLYLYNKTKSNKKIAYIATAEKVDEEFIKRIEIHRKRRSDEFFTYEEPLNLDKVLMNNYENHDIFIIECLTTWLGNLFFRYNKDKIEEESKKILDNIILFLSIEEKDFYYDKKYFDNLFFKKDKLKKITFNRDDKIFIFVSNEVGLGIVPNDAITRQYRDIHGFINQKVSEISYLSYFMVNGTPIRLK